MPHLKSTLLAVCLATAAIAGGVQPAEAVQLSADACKQLDEEKVALEMAGVESDLRLGIDEAKTLASDRLKRVVRYVDVTGAVLFRCKIEVVIPDPPPAPQATPELQAQSETGSSATAKPVAQPAAAKAEKKPGTAKPKQR